MSKESKLEKAAEYFFNNTRFKNYKTFFCEGAKWKEEIICSDEIIDKIRTSLSNAEARRIIKSI
jgi:hypothetical protein